MDMGGSVYAFAGGKGGVGKTTVTANVGLSLQDTELDVAIVDADIGMTNLGELLNIRQEIGIHEVLSGTATVEEVMIKGPGGVTIVPGERGIDSVGEADPANLTDVVEPLGDAHDIVLLDTGAGLNEQNVVAYSLADAAFLVTTQTGLSVTDTDRTRETIDRIGGTVAGTVVTRVTDQDADPRRLSRTLGADLVGLVPEYEGPVSEPHVRSAPESDAAAAYERLAATIAAYDETGGIEAALETVRQEGTTPAEAESGEPGVDPDTEDTAGVLNRLTAAVTDR